MGVTAGPGAGHPREVRVPWAWKMGSRLTLPGRLEIRGKD